MTHNKNIAFLISSSTLSPESLLVKKVDVEFTPNITILTEISLLYSYIASFDITTPRYLILSSYKCKRVIKFSEAPIQILLKRKRQKLC